jgi:hypothetical protein
LLRVHGSTAEGLASVPHSVRVSTAPGLLGFSGLGLATPLSVT